MHARVRDPTGAWIQGPVLVHCGLGSASYGNGVQGGSYSDHREWDSEEFENAIRYGEPLRNWDLIMRGGLATASLGAFTVLCGLAAAIAELLAISGKGPLSLRDGRCSSLFLHIACAVLGALTCITWAACFGAGNMEEFGEHGWTLGESFFLCFTS